MNISSEIDTSLISTEIFAGKRTALSTVIFSKPTIDEHFSGKVTHSSNHFRLVWGMLSNQSTLELNQKIKRLIDEYLQIAQQAKNSQQERSNYKTIQHQITDRVTP